MNPNAGYAPPPQGYPPPQQGYPPPQQGYPPPQGAPPPQQGYPPPQQGYPPPQQQAPPPQQGYPPPQQQAAAVPPPPQQGYQAPQQTQAPAAVPPQAPQSSGNVDLPGGVDAGDELEENSKTDLAADSMDAVNGYDIMNAMIPPPPIYEEFKEPPPPDFSAQMPRLKDEAREALLSHVAEKCCWGSKAAKNLAFTSVDHSAAFHYILETFSESRSTKWVHEPYVGQMIDGPMNGMAPLPWAVSVQIPPMFQDTVRYLEVPHTASVKPCHDCRATGYRRCYSCHGQGSSRCDWCNGRGQRRVTRYDGDHSYTDYEFCSWCGGDGRRTCHRCSGSGRIICITCDANGQLKCYIRLKVEWKNHVEDHIVERTNLPDELVRDVSGQQVFQEEHPKVWPIRGFPIPDVNQGSEVLVNRHATQYRTERLHRQRHQIRVIPVAEALCQYSEKPFTFFVYGFEHKVYAPEYPMQCCWGCSIL